MDIVLTQCHFPRRVFAELGNCEWAESAAVLPCQCTLEELPFELPTFGDINGSSYEYTALQTWVLRKKTEGGIIIATTHPAP